MSRRRALFLDATGATPPPVPPGPNRALQFIAGSTGYAALATPDTALTGTSWSISYRVRPDAASGGGYVSSRANGGLDKAAIIYNFVANTFEFFDTNNSTGGTVRLALSTPTPPNGSYYEIAFTYDGATLRAFLNGAPAGSLAAVFTLNPIASLLILGQRNNSGGGESNVTIDYVRETENGTATVKLELNEAAPGPYANTGSDGGALMVFTPAPISVPV